MNDTTDTHVHPCRSETSQKRDAENFGVSTAVAPTHSSPRKEYPRALVWNSGRVISPTSVPRRPACAELTWAAHRQLACVQTTAFGRAVVPEVYWMLAGASGSTDTGAGATPVPLSSPRAQVVPVGAGDATGGTTRLSVPPDAAIHSSPGMASRAISARPVPASAARGAQCRS